MIDFHTHILPEVDDGATNEEESKKILQEAKYYGFDKIISTSHYAPDCYEVPEYKRKDLINYFNEQSNNPEIYLGSEIFVTFNIVNLIKEFKASTINGTNYILFELPLRHDFPGVKNIINNLKENNYKPILAHPERYLEIQKNFDLLYEYQDLGLLFQSNFGSIIGEYGFSAKRTFEKMLKNHLVNFMGSDVHRSNSIYPRIPKATKKIKKLISENYFNEITTINAEKILNNINF